jgi:uncharacterized protein
MQDDAKTWIARHQVPIYFVLAFAVSWGAVLFIVHGSHLSPNLGTQRDVLPVLLAMLAGPSGAAILLTGLIHGNAGLRAWLAGARKWRLEARWYAVALLTAPFMTIALFLTLSFVSPEAIAGTLPIKPALVLFSVVLGLIAGVFEELGWTGFAVAELSRRYGVLASGLIVGVLWGAWHLIAVVSSADTSSISLPPVLVVSLALFIVLPIFRILMVWVYERTGSLLLAILMHASLTASSLMLTLAGVGGPL